MTAGHILTQESLGQYSFDQVDVPDEEDDEGFYSGEEEYELDDSIFESDEAHDRTRPVSQSIHLGSLWPRIGSVSVTSNEATSTGCDHDWALIDFDRPTDYRPNLLVPFDGEEKASRSRPLKENEKSTEDGSSRTVSLLSGTGGIKSGSLSTSLSFLMMGPAKAFTKTYTLVLSHGSGKCSAEFVGGSDQLMLLVLNAGDCGSWVVDPSTCEVYGHVVASDAMGDTYVVPLSATLRDMEKRLGAAVSIPTEADIHNWVAQHAKSETEPSMVSAAGKKKRVAFNDSRTDRVQYPRDVQKLAEHSSSQASMPIASMAAKNSVPFVDHCISCNAQFIGTSENVRSNLQRHLRTCSKQGKDRTPEIKIPNSPRDNRVALDESSKKPQVSHSKDVQQGVKANVSTQLRNPIPWSLRSMYSDKTKKPSDDPQQKDENKGKSTSTSQGKKHTGSTSSAKPTVTALPTSNVKDSHISTKISRPRKDSDSSPSSKPLSTPSPALAVRTSRDLPRAPIPTPRQSLSPFVPRPHHGGKSPASPPPPPPLRVQSHGSVHERSHDPHHQSNNNHQGQVSYEGYTFTKCSSRQTGQKETWAVARMVPMPVSQKDLQDQIKRNRKKQTSALDEYNDENMKGFKRKQVDNLIWVRTKLDGDYGFEYELASIKLDTRKIRGKSIETVSMQVILKRQVIAGFRHENSARPSIDIHAKLPSQVMDLTKGDELERLRDYGPPSQPVNPGWGGPVPFTGYPEHGAFPASPIPGGVFDQGTQYDDNRRTPLYAASHSFDPIHPPTQGIGQPPHPQIVTTYHQDYNTQGRPEKVHKADEKRKTPYTVETRNESQKRLDDPSNASSHSDISFGVDSLNSWTKTDATPDTDITDRSREHRQEKTSRKESNDRYFNNNKTKDRTEETASPHEKEEVSYREHRRKEPMHDSRSLIPRPRDVSSDSSALDPDRYDPRTSLRYPHDTSWHDMEPAHGTYRHHRRSSISPLSRPSHRQVVSYSYDPDRTPMTHSSRDLNPMHERRPALYPDSSFDAEDPPGWGSERVREQKETERENLRLMREVDERVRRRTAEVERLDGEIKRRESEWDERERWRHRTTDGGGLHRRDTRVEVDRLDREIERRESELNERESWRNRRASDGRPRRRDPNYDYD